MTSNVPPMPDEQSLSERQEAFVRLFAEHEPLLRGLILSLVPVWDDAAEILQETSLSAWRKFNTFEMGTNFQAWIGRIAIYEIHNFRARNKNSRLQFNSELLEQLIETHENDSDYQEAQRTALIKCLDKLRDSDRKLIVERYSAERRGKQIAESQGRPPDSIYKALKRIRAALFECINRVLSREKHE